MDAYSVVVIVKSVLNLRSPVAHPRTAMVFLKTYEVLDGLHDGVDTDTIFGRRWMLMRAR